MAGIGFKLQKLASEDNFSGLLRAYFHSAVIAVGPWMMIVISISTVVTFLPSVFSIKDLNGFMSIFMYNLCSSFIITGPLYMITARYVSDCLYLRYMDPIPGICVTSAMVLVAPGLFLATVFYLFYATMSPITTILSIVNFFLLSQTWMTMLFLGLLQDFRAITLSWLLGMALSIVLSLYFASLYQVDGILIGINIGLCFLVASLTAQVLTEYPHPYKKPNCYQYYFAYYNDMFWSGLFFFGSMWVDKLIMWGAPEAITHLNNLKTYPIYDGGMFLSYLTIVPVMALFVFDLETNFYLVYVEYVSYIETNAPYSFIEDTRKIIVSEILENGRSFIILQGAITIIAIIFAPHIIEALAVDYLELSIFRLGAIGAFFSSLNFFIVIIFSYFDSQDNMLRVTSTMFLSNIIATLVSLHLGFAFYGYGYCFSMIFSFFVAAILFINFLDKLNYHIFISNNVKRQEIKEQYLKAPLEEYLKEES